MSGVGKERSSAETSVELAFCVAPERVKTYRRIETAGRKTEECGLSFGPCCHPDSPRQAVGQQLALQAKAQNKRATALRTKSDISV